MDVDEDASHREDCLHLSVYVPRSAFESDSAQLPVYLYFHGGAYLIGSSAVRNGAYIVTAHSNIFVLYFVTSFLSKRVTFSWPESYRLSVVPN